MADNHLKKITGLHENINTEQLDRWASFYSNIEARADDTWSSAEWLHFMLEGQQFVISTRSLDEVTTVSIGASLPHLSSATIGLVNLSGDVVLTFDLGQILNLRSEIKPRPAQRLFLLKDDSDEKGQRSGFLVDQILSVIEINEADLQPFFDAEVDDKNNYIDAVIESESGQSISRINPRALLDGIKEMLF